jgi:hypothetical protein
MTKKYIEVAIERSKPYNHSGHDHTSKKCSQLKVSIDTDVTVFQPGFK